MQGHPCHAYDPQLQHNGGAKYQTFSSRRKCRAFVATETVLSMAVQRAGAVQGLLIGEQQP